MRLMNHAPEIEHQLAQLAARATDFALTMSHYLSEHDELRLSAHELAAARSLTDTLVLYLKRDEDGPVPPIRRELVGPYVSAFGDGLAPVLKDVLGDAVPPAFTALCVDGYWRMIRGHMSVQ